MKTLKNSILERILFESNTAGAKLKRINIEISDANAEETMGEAQRNFSIEVDLFFQFALNKPMQKPVDNKDMTSLDSKEYEEVEKKIKSSAFKNYVANFFK